MKCPRCGYEWKPKISQPKECPRCKGRIIKAPTLLQGTKQPKYLKGLLARGAGFNFSKSGKASVRQVLVYSLVVLLMAPALALILTTRVEIVAASPDDNFGYDTIGTAGTAYLEYTMRGSVFTVPSSGTADNITVYLYDEFEVVKQCAIYKHSDNTLLTNGTTENKEDLVDPADWLTFTFSVPPTLEADTAYVLEVRAEDMVLIYYDVGDTDQGHYEDDGLESFPAEADFTHEDRKYSIFCTYTATGADPPSVTTQAATLVEETTARLNANLTDFEGENPSRMFDWDTDSGVPYANEENVGVGETGAYYKDLTTLSAGTKYYFRARAVNSEGTGTGSELTFSTKPDAPTGLDAKSLRTSTIDLTWVKGTGAENTIIRRKTISYPDNENDGTGVYSGTGTSTTDTGLDNGTQYFYRAWAWDENDKYSDSYSEDTETTILLTPTLYLPENASIIYDDTPTFTWENGANADNHWFVLDNDQDFSSPGENLVVQTETYTIPEENSLPYDNYWWKVIAENTTAENESEVWTFEWTPEGEEWSDNIYPTILYAGSFSSVTENYENWINNVHMPNDNMSIKVKVTHDVSVESVILEWYDNGDWYPYAMENVGEDNYAITMLNLENEREYSFNILTYGEGYQSRLEWLRYDNETGYTNGPETYQTHQSRRYIGANYATENLDYEQFYFHDATYLRSPLFGSLEHEQQPGTALDTNYLQREIPSEMISGYCNFFVLVKFNENITIPENTKISNFYYYFWWNNNTDESLLAYKKGLILGPPSIDDKWIYKSDNKKVYPIIGYEYGEYYLTTGFWDVTDTYYNSLDIYGLEFRITKGDSDIEWISKEGMTSYFIFNLPDSATLAEMDSDDDGWDDNYELYTSYTNPFQADTDADGTNDSEDSDPLIPQASLYLPENNSTVDNTPYFEWTRALYVDNHYLSVDNDFDFSSPNEDRRLFTSENSYTIPEGEDSLPVDNYYWKVDIEWVGGSSESGTWTFKVGQWEHIENWVGTIDTQVSWQHVENWSGSAVAFAQWELVENLIGTVHAFAEWNLIEEWSSSIQAFAEWNLIDGWSGGIETQVEWQLVETWTGTVEAPTTWHLIETWIGAVEAYVGWQLVETWTGGVEAFSGWNFIEEWAGTVEAPAEWQLIETWTGTVQAHAAWALIETWTGTVKAPHAWSLIETWAGSVANPMMWNMIESWTGGIWGAAEWNLAEEWSGVIVTGGTPPIITSVYLENSVLDPQTPYKFFIEVQDNDNLNDIKAVWLKLYENVKSQGDNDNARNHYTFKWVRGENFSEVGPDNASPYSHLVVENSSAGQDNLFVDNWAFSIKLGAVAAPTNWDVFALVRDSGSVRDNTELGNEFAVNIYLSLSFSAENITFRGWPGDQDAAADENPITATISANVNFDFKDKVSGPFTTENENLYVDNDGIKPYAITLSTTYQTLYGNVGWGAAIQKLEYYLIDIPENLAAATYYTTFYTEVVAS